MLRLGRESRQEDDRFNLFFQTPAPPVPRARTFEVDRAHRRPRRRASWPSTPPRPPTWPAGWARAGAQGVAICLLHAYAHPAHEEAMAAACRAALPDDAFVITSSEVWPEMREYERAMTTVMCAYVGPIMARYLAGLETATERDGDRLPDRDHGVERGGDVGLAGLPASDLHGGVRGSRRDHRGRRRRRAHRRRPGALLRHGRHHGEDRHRPPGPTRHHARLPCRRERTAAAAFAAGRGYPVKIPVVDLAEVGAGGGSIASVDSGGGLRVGPRSAGSIPGPACYGRGGTEPTVTDANLLMGYLKSGPSLRWDLARPRAERQGHRIGHRRSPGFRRRSPPRTPSTVWPTPAWPRPSGWSPSQRGIDPRDFTLVAFGGAGPLHAVELADTFGIGRVVIPRAAGVASAIGLITSDLAAERVLTRLMPTDERRSRRGGAVFDEIEEQAVQRAARGRRRAGGRPRRRGPLPGPGPSADRAGATRPGVQRPPSPQIDRAFLDRYRDAYGIDLDAPTELVNFRVRVSRTVEKLTPVPHPAGASQHAGSVR